MQDILAILIVAAAAVYLVRQTWLRLARRSGGSCDSCPSCGANESVKSRPLVTISTNLPRR